MTSTRFLCRIYYMKKYILKKYMKKYSLILGTSNPLEMFGYFFRVVKDFSDTITGT